jgi:hypothetical protein
MSRDDFEKRLAAFDFSGDSEVRSSLRRRLLTRRERGPAVAPLALAFAAAALSLLLLPARPPKPTAFPVGPHGFPVMPGTLPVRARVRPQPVFETRPVTLDEIFATRRLSEHI